MFYSAAGVLSRRSQGSRDKFLNRRTRLYGIFLPPRPVRSFRFFFFDIVLFTTRTRDRKECQGHFDAAVVGGTRAQHSAQYNERRNT